MEAKTANPIPTFQGTSPTPRSSHRGPALRLILLGAPGVGKGTQAQLLANSFGAAHLSTGDMFRAAKNLPPRERTDAMNAAMEYMRRGELVPDQTVLQMIAEKMPLLRGRSGFLMDGFPRTVVQAQAFDAMLAKEHIRLDAVLSYDLPVEKIVARISGRRTCPKCKAVFHIESLPPKVPGICDHCGSELYQREDDRPESVRVRLDTYEKATAPLVDYYQKRNMLISVNADGAPEEILERTIKALKLG